MTLWKNDFVQKNKYSRPGTKLKGVKKIVLHWTSTPGASDENEKKYFDGSDGGGSRYASAHIFADRNSSTCIIPLNEVAYHANDNYEKKNGIVYRGVKEITPNANFYTLGYEMCVEKDGTIHSDTINRTIRDCAELCKMYKLTAEDIVRHYDVTHKPCPKPFVDDPKKFDDFKKQVSLILNPVKKAPVYPGKIIKKGDKGEFVESIQEKLGIKVDGDFGKITDMELRKFQKDNGLDVDGKAGPLTWSKLF